MKYFVGEVFSGKLMELEEDKYTERREKVYTFMKIPREFEKVYTVAVPMFLSLAHEVTKIGLPNILQFPKGCVKILDNFGKPVSRYAKFIHY